jgi:hypothetical protein
MSDESDESVSSTETATSAWLERRRDLRVEGEGNGPALTGGAFELADEFLDVVELDELLVDDELDELDELLLSLLVESEAILRLR